MVKRIIPKSFDLGDLSIESEFFFLPQNFVRKEVKHLHVFYKILQKKINSLKILLNEGSKRSFSNQKTYAHYLLNLTSLIITDEQNKENFVLSLIESSKIKKFSDIQEIESRQSEISELDSIKYYYDNIIKIVKKFKESFDSEIQKLKKEEFVEQEYNALAKEQIQLFKELQRYLISSITEVRRYFAAIRLRQAKLPLISVILPAYEEEDYIKGAIMSVKKQTYPNYEVIVGENVTTSTKEKSKFYTDKYAHTQTKGLSAGRNVGGYKAKGEILVFVDADSRLHPNALEYLYQEFKKNDHLPPKKRIVGGVCSVYMSNFKVIKGLSYGKRTSRQWKARFYNLIYPNYLGLLFHLGLPFANGVMFCTKEAFKKVRFNEKTITHQDDEWLRNLAKVGRLTRIHKLFAYTSDRRMAARGYMKVMKTWFMKDGSKPKTKYYK